MSRTPNSTVVAIAFVIAFAVQASGAFAGCGDYLYVRGEKTTMSRHTAPHMSVQHEADSGITAQTQVVSDETPAQSPCSQGRCENDNLPTAPPAPLPTTVNCNDVAVMSAPAFSKAELPRQRRRSTNAGEQTNPPESIFRPPE